MRRSTQLNPMSLSRCVSRHALLPSACNTFPVIAVAATTALWPLVQLLKIDLILGKEEPILTDFDAAFTCWLAYPSSTASQTVTKSFKPPSISSKPRLKKCFPQPKQGDFLEQFQSLCSTKLILMVVHVDWR